MNEHYVVYNNNKYKLKNNKWYFFVVNGDGGLIKDNSWYEIINKKSINKINTYYFRCKKLERILKNDSR